MLNALIAVTALGAVLHTDADLYCLAQNIYHEARGESLRGQIAVGYVTMNRVHDHRFPNDICAVVKEPGQFSWYRGKFPTIKEPKAYEQSETIAKWILRKRVPDPTEGALFFHKIGHDNAWFRTMTPKMTIGKHIFY